ncbi:hypothetical protein [Phaffia rhodozyma]|uniref:Uncharacterized protein n=1 Tax=Phaffia rhodozyma TaxID=264483 RepID=A0A0F7SGG0_PHARH|nr:hypothetical protein [Phaffia rhodozyma]
MSSSIETRLSDLNISNSPEKSSPSVSEEEPASPEVFRERLNSLRLNRVLSIEAFESSQWKTIVYDKSYGKIDPKVLVGKNLVFPRDEGKIVRAHSRVFWVENEGGRVSWQVQLEGFHHSTDEEDAEDPEAHDPYTLNTSSRWDTLFEDYAHYRYTQDPTEHQSAPTDPSTEVAPILITDASYGKKTEPDGQEAIGFGIKWGKPGSVCKEEWAWVWGELNEIEEEYSSEDEGEEGEEAEGDEQENTEEPKKYKRVHLLEFSYETDAEGDVVNGERGVEEADEQGKGLVNGKGEGIVDPTDK